MTTVEDLIGISKIKENNTNLIILNRLKEELIKEENIYKVILFEGILNLIKIISSIPGVRYSNLFKKMYKIVEDFINNKINISSNKIIDKITK